MLSLASLQWFWPFAFAEVCGFAWRARCGGAACLPACLLLREEERRGEYCMARRVVASLGVLHVEARQWAAGAVSLTALEAKGDEKKAGAVCVLCALQRLCACMATMDVPGSAQPTLYYSPPACFRHSPPTLLCTGHPFYRFLTVPTRLLRLNFLLRSLAPCRLLC
jgi:hypothetical protein